MVEGHPGRFARQGSAAGEKMRLYRVSLYEIRSQTLRQLTQISNHAAIIETRLVNHLDLQSAFDGCIDEQVGRCAAGERRDGRFDPGCAGELGKSQQILSRSGNAVGFYDCEQTQAHILSRSHVSYVSQSLRPNISQS